MKAIFKYRLYVLYKSGRRKGFFKVYKKYKGWKPLNEIFI